MSAPRSLRSMPARGSRVRRKDANAEKLESMAAEYALLAQRRARLMRQMDLLARQTRAATNNLDLLDARMRHLSKRMRIAEPGAPVPIAPGEEMAGPPAPASLTPAPATPSRRGRRNLVLEY